jgi:alanyl-tRNA synthetase
MGVEQLIATNKILEKQLSALKKSNAGNVQEDLLKDAIEVNGVRFIAKQVLMEAEDMKNVSFALRKEKNLVMVLAAKVDKKALLTVMLTDDIVAKGYNAGAMIRVIAKEIDGGGGGQAFFATAGGVKPSGIVAALQKAKEIIG